MGGLTGSSSMTLINSVALNPTGTGYSMNRVLGFDLVYTLSNNYAWKYMLVNSAKVTDSNHNGENCLVLDFFCEILRRYVLWG